MRVPAQHSNSNVRRERDLRVLSRLMLLLFCAFVLAGGFVFAAQQHFAAVKYGYTSEELRKEHDRLLREQEQLILQREQASAPARLESAARRLGLKPISSKQVGIVRSAQATTSAASPTRSKPPEKKKQR